MSVRSRSVCVADTTEMVELNKDRLHSQLILEEGLRLQAYDDATGKPVPAGQTCRGKLTIGIGHNLDAKPLTASQQKIIGHDGRTLPITIQQALMLLDDDITDVCRWLTTLLPWWTQLDEIRARVLCDLTFNMGVHTLLTFKHFLSDMRTGNYEVAGTDLENSLWYKQVGSRAIRLVAMITTGEDYIK